MEGLTDKAKTLAGEVQDKAKDLAGKAEGKLGQTTSKLGEMAIRPSRLQELKGDADKAVDSARKRISDKNSNKA